MKKFLLLIALVSITLSGIAQKGKVTSALSFIDQGVLDKAKEALDQAMTNESTSTWFNTYFAKGQLCQALFKSENPAYKAYYSDPLSEAYTAYEKSMQLDTKGSIKKKIISKMIYNSLAADLYTQAGAQFEAKDYTNALKSFETQIKVTESDKYIGAVDTGMYFNAGLAAVNSKKYDEGIKYFEKCAEMKYMGITPYYQIYDALMGKGDTTKAEATLKDLPNKFPGDKNITLQLIDLYIKSNKYSEALKYIDMAKKDDANNSSLYLAAGVIYLNQESYDQAIPELEKSIQLKGDLFDSQYGLGATYINKAADLFKKANDIMDVKKYAEAVDVANGVYAKALPYMEKANQLNPNDIDTMSRLQELYYRLKAKDPSYAAKYDAMKAKVDAAKNK